MNTVFLLSVQKKTHHSINLRDLKKGGVRWSGYLKIYFFFPGRRRAD
jgi:hypothetical protein